MKQLRSALTVFFSALLILTFQQMAAARGIAPAVGEAVLCLGGVQVAVPVDASGAPAKPSHFCPDCTTHASADIAGATVPPASFTQSKAVFVTGDAFIVMAARPKTPRARGPPVRT